MKSRRDEEDTATTGPLEVRDTPLRALSAADAIVVVLYPAGANPGRRYALSRPEHVVGRRADLDIPLDVESVSRRHGRFVREGEEWFVEDLGSTNGSYVNDEAIASKQVLRDGDIVRFGESVLKFLVGSNVERAYHEEIYRLSILDGLTGVHNRRFFHEVLDREVARSTRHGGHLALVIFDIDHFKRINDTYGHLAGDQVLQALCRRLRPRIRREDLLARIGGEEFACVLPDTPHVGARAFAEDLRVLVAKEAFPHEGKLLTVTISLGVAVLEPSSPSWRTADAADSQELVRRADANLYAAKNAGRNRVVG